MIDWIVISIIAIIIIWVLSFIFGIISLIIYCVSKNVDGMDEQDWALFCFIICAVIFVSIPLLVFLAILNGLTTAWTQFLQNIIK